jgi:8-amino-7-oxononanoate synthase
MHDDWKRAVADELDRLEVQHLLRRRRVVRVLDATHLEIDGRQYVNFASNNYLGLTHHPRVVSAMASAAQAHGAGSAASPLITGHTTAHAAAEKRLAEWKGTEAAVLLPSGYQANLAAIQTLAAIGERTAGGVRFLLDKLVHASLIDAARMAGQPFRVFPHNHLDKLDRLLREADATQRQIVLTESIFSMDGDAADLRGLAELKRRHGFMLLLDEAHASGVFGPGGAGLAAELGLSGLVDVTVVTLSKALGCGGGAVCGSSLFIEALVNFARAYIYSTSIPPSLAAAAEAAIDVLRDEPQRRLRLRSLANYVRKRLSAAGLHLPPGDSPILPIVLGNEKAALSAAESLQLAGLWTLPIRPPTVPRTTSRLRITLSSQHSDDEIEQFLRALSALPKQMNPT